MERNFNTLPSLACWFIWLERNKFIFELRTPSIQAVVLKIQGMLENSVGLGPRKGKSLRIQKTHVYALPTVGWFDGAAQANGLLSGAGGVLKILEILATSGFSTVALVQIQGLNFSVCGHP
jgi:hypothetical protein